LTLCDERSYSALMPVVPQQKPSIANPLDFVTENDWILIRAGARRLRFAPGEALIRQDSPGGTMFVLRNGSARIEANGARLASLGPGQICGEIAFLDNRLSSASVIAEVDLEADAIAWSELHRIFKMFPHLGSRFYQSLAVVLSRRLRETSGQLSQCRKK
jgi:CRP/FNR family transcriptional regulator, cyclic AMP receptor protein